MSNKHIVIFGLFFAAIIVASNYLVTIPINEWITYGAITYPFTFLFTDVLSERYSKEVALKVVRYGIVFAVIPTLLISDFRIAFASIFAFFFVQQLDIFIFHYLKERFYKLWWLRNNVSTLTSQFLDTVIFFLIAFAFIIPFEDLAKMIIGDYSIKIILSLLDTPFFYVLAFPLRKKDKN
ncbi:MAG: queuosine precursor transporter [Helicobacteraceae bacterium]